MNSLIGLKIDRVYMNIDKTLLICKTNKNSIGFVTEKGCAFYRSQGIEMIFNKTVLSVINQEVMDKKGSLFYVEIITNGLFHCRMEIRNSSRKRCTVYLHEIPEPFVFTGLKDITYDF